MWKEQLPLFSPITLKLISVNYDASKTWIEPKGMEMTLIRNVYKNWKIRYYYNDRRMNQEIR